MSDRGDLSEEEIEEVVILAIEEAALEDEWFGAYGCSLDQILDGLVYAYSKKIIHRDLKPANIFVELDLSSDDDENFVVYKLADFGIAKNLTDDAPNSVTVANLYSAPWQPEPNLTNEKLFQDTWDVFAWGVMAIALITEEIPKTYEDIYTLLDGPFKAKVGENLHTYFCKIVHKKADKRPGNVKLLQKNIRKLNKERKKALGIF